ncbi:hypothetical protein CON65_00190 [Bacillus pseudomycoides]|uniref:Haloacid dehalogenase n=1 Tax=Bacillus pseudomycoides TaxID=64104 RepID=A0AA91VGZ5_9BACI|nr:MULTISPECIES: hypothetical protein [Bacillus]PEB53449.1 hypothetical protein COO03_09865 [Bacillus sp. AFS098217]PED84558.1 hypothetical protein CON65_00190 [Bacillus pseudomycoides]PEU14848.1 hypothetical protein CN524_09190 [Bacillus sp. AFS019443]PEU19399.1 hypothetical protein CN525_06580 [Bacillus sp. AFS014408]PFW64520.1 hypothetical protein COL20_05130 [Bacillus sp. AFS075034]
MGKIQISGEVIETKAIAFDKDGTLFQAIPFWQEIDRLRKQKFSQIVGDTVVDVKMAKDAGSIAVGIANHKHAIEELMPYADFIITDYSDIQVLTKKKQ